MNKFIFLLGPVILTLGLNACTNVAPTPDWVGSYTGIMPCADCPGIQTAIELFPDSTYTIQTKYMGKSDEVFSRSGKFLWNEPNAIIDLDNDLFTRLRIEENALKAVFDGDAENNIPTRHYMFLRSNPELAGTYWKLTELNGKQVVAGQSPKEPRIILDLYTHLFSGNAGCNTIMGSCHFKSSGKISFSSVAATKMLCSDMNLEEDFLKIFDLIESYKMENNILTFYDAAKTRLARFTANAPN